MSAAEVIKQIQALPPEEQDLVRQFVLNGEGADDRRSEIRFVDRATARVVGERIMEENEELFRRLAQ